MHASFNNCKTTDTAQYKVCTIVQCTLYHLQNRVIKILSTLSAYQRASEISTCFVVSTNYKSAIANGKKDWVRKSKIRKVTHLRKVRKSDKLYKPAQLRICDLRNLFADRPSLAFAYIACPVRWKCSKVLRIN